MMLSLSNILSCRAKIDAESFPIKDAMLSIRDRRLTYVVLDTGTWFDSHLALVHADQIGTISTEAKNLTLLTDKAALEHAPVLNSDSLFAMESLPPVVVGPFGNTISPLMMLAAVPNAPSPVDQRAQSIDTRFKRYSDIQGIDVFGKDGQLGVIEDLFVSTDTLEITVLQLSNGKQSSGRGMLVPSEKLRYMANQETHMVLDVTSNELTDAPHFGAADRLDRNCLAKLRHYYQ